MFEANNFLNVGAASERFFRCYNAHCVVPDLDTLFSLLSSMHSLNDKLETGVGIDFFDIDEFVALKCLRNYFHHQQELRHIVKVIPVGNYPIVTDLMVLCLLPKEIVGEAIEGVSEKYRERTRESCQKKFHWYGPVVNINPCLFNFVVSVYERLKNEGIPLTGDAVGEFERSYRCDEENGISHFVEGNLSARAGNISELLADIIVTEGLQRSYGQ